MAKFINFFPRQMFFGMGGSNSGIYYSDIFEVSEAKSTYYEFRIYGITGAFAPSAILTMQENADPSSDLGWATYGSELTENSTITSSGLIDTVPKRFLRAKLAVTPETKTVVHFNVRTFC